jgi:hypothetical protein
MRIIVIAFAALACLKVWTHDKLYRSAMSDALIEAYRERAQQVCSRESARHGTAAAGLWARAAEITVGGDVARVMLWDYDNPLWGVRYRHPHLVLTSGGARQLTCATT